MTRSKAPMGTWASYAPGCRGKRAYPSKAHAQSAVRTSQQDRGQDATMNAYRCKVCKGWHIGHGRYAPFLPSDEQE